VPRGPVTYASRVGLRVRVRWHAAVLVGTLALASCGGGGGGHGAAGPPPSGPLGPAQAFPSPGGKTLMELRRGLGPGPRLASSVFVLQPGRARFAFALFDRTRRQISDAPAAVYVAPAGGGAVKGPFRARYHSLAVSPRFRSRTVASDPDSAQSIYVAEPTFPAPGNYQVLGVAQLDQRLVGATPVTVAVRRGWRPPPEVGDLVPHVHTPTLRSVHGRISLIDTRNPPDTMHGIDFAGVLGKRPVMLLFASPGLCRSRVCGPVTDVVEELKARYGQKAAFIHVEIFRDNNVALGERSQVRAFGLPSQPWLFAIDRHGRVCERLEGGFSGAEAKAALDAAVAGWHPRRKR